MKGLVLAGGKGSRLRPFTYSGAKQLVPIANTPVLHFPVRQLVDAGITEIGLVVGDTADQVRDAMGDGSAFGARFTYIRQPAPLGIAHAVLVARDFLGADPFVLYLGDNVLMGGIEGFAHAFAEGSAAASIILKEVADPRPFGVAEVRDGRLLRMVEKPLDPPSNLAVIGIYAFRPAVFDIIMRQAPSARGELEISDTISALADCGSAVMAMLTHEPWIDTGKMEDILVANRIVLDSLGSGRRVAGSVRRCSFSGPVFIEDGAVLESCEVVGPVAVAAGARLRHCRLGPHVAIGPGARLDAVTLRNAIVMESAQLAECAGVQDSMIGRFACVRGVPPGSRLTLGDHSRIEVAR
jgi:glucose-1-phosphate thymidylyltransferase